MLKKLIFLLLCVSLSLGLSACSSSDSKDESNVEAGSAEDPLDDDEEYASDFEDNEGGDGELGDLEELGDGEGDSEVALEGDALEGDLTAEEDGAEAPDDFAADSEAGDSEFGEEFVEDSGEGVADSDAFSDSESMPAPESDSETALGDAPDATESLAASESDTDFGETFEAPKKWIPVKKIKTDTYNRAGFLVNTVYLVRPNETMEDVAQKVYGDSAKSEDLLKMNSHFTGKTLKTGDKVYYSSTNRPNDDSKIITFYEDNNVEPQYYTSKSGDNIRAIAKELLGDDRSWMEVWSTNPDVESKGDLTEGTQLRYWAGAAPTVVAKNDTAMDAPPPPDMGDDLNDPPPPPDMGSSDPPPPPDMAANDPPPPPPPPPSNPTLNDPPPPPDMAANDPPPPPPPPPPPKMNGSAVGSVDPPPPPPPPPPPSFKKKPFKITKKAKGGAVASMDSLEDPNQTMALAVGAILLLAAVVLFIIIRKKKAKRQSLDFNTTTQTQIE